MRCPKQTGDLDVLLDYSAGRLNPTASAAFEDHLRGCEECAQFTAEQQQLWPVLDVWEAPEISPRFDQRLYAKIEAEKRETWWGRLRQSTLSWKPVLAGATVAATIVAALFLPQPPDPARAPQREVTERSERLEPEQIERALEDLEMLRQLSGSTTGSLPAPAL